MSASTPPMPQAEDARAESMALYDLLKDLPEEEFSRTTQFKGWTIMDVLGHLHIWNMAALATLRDGAAFRAFFDELSAEMTKPDSSLRKAEEAWLAAHNEGGNSPKERLTRWKNTFEAMAEEYGRADPSKRVLWAGPDMSARSKITARLMETWAHAQAVFDALGETRQEHDRIKNIAMLGVNTFGWTFKNRGQDVPEMMPYLRLTAPSGEIWEWGEENAENRIEGDAVEFCQTVTQTRNIADTSLQLTGETAKTWMAQAQCFAGAPETPPPPGTRRKAAQG